MRRRPERRWLLPVVAVAVITTNVALGAPPEGAKKPTKSTASKSPASSRPKSKAAVAGESVTGVSAKGGATPVVSSTAAVAPHGASGGLSGADTSELRALREAEQDLFVPRSVDNPWPIELPEGLRDRASEGGLPPVPPPSGPTSVVGGGSLSWLTGLRMPDLPMRWDARVIRYLEFFRDDPRGRRVIALWYRRSGRYRELIQEQLRAQSLPEDLAWVALAESGFDPFARSRVGASGLWQFMPETAKLYGLSVDRWADSRTSPIRSTQAAIRFLGDLYRRLGTWELALAAYNVGYGALLGTIKRFNTNDYWELSRYENGLPWETTHYVPKILALAIVHRNPRAFGLDGVTVDPSLDGDHVDVPAGSELAAVAAVAGCSVKELQGLNPELRAGRAPPSVNAAASRTGPAVLSADTYTLLVPRGRGGAVRDATARLAPRGQSLERYVVRFGETLDQIAEARRTTRARLVDLNAIGKEETIRGGTVLVVPTVAESKGSKAAEVATRNAAKTSESLATVIVPGQLFAYPDRTRVFYRIIPGDTLHEVAAAFGVSIDELRAWNDLDPTARLHEGMTLQVYVPKSIELGRIVHFAEGEVRVLVAGSDAFYDLEQSRKGRRRLTVTARDGDTLESLGKRHGVSAVIMEKINRRPRADILQVGESAIVYVAAARSSTGGSPDAQAAESERAAKVSSTPTVAVAPPVELAETPERSEKNDKLESASGSLDESRPESSAGAATESSSE